MSCPGHIRKSAVSVSGLGVLALLAVLIIVTLEMTKRLQPDPGQRDKQMAAELMQRAMQAVKTEKLRMGIALDRFLDPNETGMIGVEYNDLTTTRGSLTAKRTSTNPAFAAIIVEMLSRVGVRPGDGVAVNFSGSFPALNIAVLSAVKVLNLQPAIISSIGASMYGANQPTMTWLDMERILAEQGLFQYRSLAASLGGIEDARGGLGGTGVETGLQAIRRNGIPLLTEGDPFSLADDINKRLALFDRGLGGRRPAVFINVGGSLTSLGSGSEGHRLPTGLLTRIPLSKHPERGIIFRMGERGVPVVHLLQIRSIAVQYGIPVDPPPMPAALAGKSPTMGRYSIPLAVTGLALLIALLIFLRKTVIRSRPAGGA